jgi:hypothetical protein
MAIFAVALIIVAYVAWTFMRGGQGLPVTKSKPEKNP